MLEVLLRVVYDLIRRDIASFKVSKKVGKVWSSVSVHDYV